MSNPRLARQADFPRLAQFIFEQCRHPETQCIHSSTGETAETIRDEIARWHESGEILFAVAYVEGALAAAAGCEFDLDLGRGWVRGPFAIEEGWQDLAERTFAAMVHALPPEVTRLDTFLSVMNERGRSFYKAQGFEKKGLSHVYTALRPENFSLKPEIPDFDCRPVTKALIPAFAALHDEIFPATYYTGEAIAKMRDDHHRVFVVSEGNGVLGYLNAVKEPEAEEGYIEFLGVRETARGRGIGGALLRAALHWFFEELKLPQVGLTVSDTNVNARGLYESVGFRSQYTGVNQRLVRAPPD